MSSAAKGTTAWKPSEEGGSFAGRKVKEHTAAIVVEHEATSEDERVGKEPHNGRKEEWPQAMAANRSLADRNVGGKEPEGDAEGVGDVGVEAQSCTAAAASVPS